MPRSQDNDIAMRAAINKAITAFNAGEENAAAQCRTIWRDYFYNSESSPGDHDALKLLVDLMGQLIPNEAEMTAARKCLVKFERDHKLNDPCYALYDLSIMPPQFDFICFLSQAKAMAGERPLHVVFQPRDDGGYVKPSKYPNDEAIYRVEHICLPACFLYDATCTLLPSRDASRPEGEWLEGIKTSHDGIMDVYERFGFIGRAKATKRSVELVGNFVKRYKKPIVTITIRSTFRNVSRNSDKDIWLSVAEALSDRYQPVFVPDTSEAFDQWEHPYEYYPIGAIDLDSRLALYEQATMNFFDSNGPGALGWFSHIPYLGVGIRAEGYVTAEKWEGLRVPVGTQPPYFLDRQKIIWETLNADEIVGEFHAMMSDV